MSFFPSKLIISPVDGIANLRFLSKESWSCLYKNGSHWLFCELKPMQLNLAPFARICTSLNVLPLDAVISPVNCRQSALLAPL